MIFIIHEFFIFKISNNTNYTLFGFREVSLDNNPNTAVVMKKKAVA